MTNQMARDEHEIYSENSRLRTENNQLSNQNKSMLKTLSVLKMYARINHDKPKDYREIIQDLEESIGIKIP